MKIENLLKDLKHLINEEVDHPPENAKEQNAQRTKTKELFDKIIRHLDSLQGELKDNDLIKFANCIQELNEPIENLPVTSTFKNTLEAKIKAVWVSQSPPTKKMELETKVTQKFKAVKEVRFVPRSSLRSEGVKLNSSSIKLLTIEQLAEAEGQQAKDLERDYVVSFNGKSYGKHASEDIEAYTEEMAKEEAAALADALRSTGITEDQVSKTLLLATQTGLMAVGKAQNLESEIPPTTFNPIDFETDESSLYSTSLSGNEPIVMEIEVDEAKNVRIYTSCVFDVSIKDNFNADNVFHVFTVKQKMDIFVSRDKEVLCECKPKTTLNARDTTY